MCPSFVSVNIWFMDNLLKILGGSCFLIITSIWLAGTVQAQDYGVRSIEDEYRFVTEKWLEVSDNLKEYEGLSDYCNNEDYQRFTMEILTLLHEYNDVVYEILTDPYTDKYSSQQEYAKILKDIKKFESKEVREAFKEFMDDNCAFLGDLEADKNHLTKRSTRYSFSGQLYVMETMIYRFLKRIDKRVVSIDDSIHLIHPEHKMVPIKMLAQND